MRKLTGLCLVLMFCICTTASAQTTEITGKVIDANGLPVPNASVREKSTKTGTTANASGVFTIKVKNNATLIISAIGFETQEVPATANVSVTLALDIKGMNEVVVTGYSLVSNRRTTGSSERALKSRGVLSCSANRLQRLAYFDLYWTRSNRSALTVFGDSGHLVNGRSHAAPRNTVRSCGVCSDHR